MLYNDAMHNIKKDIKKTLSRLLLAERTVMIVRGESYIFTKIVWRTEILCFLNCWKFNFGKN